VDNQSPKQTASAECDSGDRSKTMQQILRLNICKWRSRSIENMAFHSDKFRYLQSTWKIGNSRRKTTSKTTWVIQVVDTSKMLILILKAGIVQTSGKFAKLVVLRYYNLYLFLVLPEESNISSFLSQTKWLISRLHKRIILYRLSNSHLPTKNPNP
jgi:hypothetical protein